MAIQLRKIFPVGAVPAGVPLSGHYVDLELEGDGKDKTVIIGPSGLLRISAVIGCGSGSNCAISSDGREAKIEFEKPPPKDYKFHITVRGTL